jgi:hypothetical protein
LEIDGRNPESLFGNTIQYAIPLFQRSYAWGESNWTSLWVDVCRTAVSLRAFDRRSHFIGSVVTQQRLTSAGALDMRDVVDGQQRLTTIQMMLVGVLKALREFDVEPRLIDRVGHLVDNGWTLRDTATWSDSRLKVMPTHVDREPFIAAMREVLDGQPSPSPSSFEACIAFYYARACETLGAFQGTLTDTANALVSAIVDCLEFSAISLSQRDDAFVVFESLNTRGEKLTPADLIKNLVFQSITARGGSDSNSEEIHDKYWALFDTPYWQERIGNQQQSRVTTFLKYWLIAATGEDLPHDHDIYPTFKTYLVSNAVTLEALEGRLKEIHSLARARQELLHKLHNPDYRPQSATEWFEYRAEVLGNQSFTPLVLLALKAIRSHDAGKLGQIETILSRIESWMVRRAILTLSSTMYGPFAAAVLTHTLRGLDTGESVTFVDAYLTNQTSPKMYWPDDEEVRHAITSEWAADKKQSRARMILEAVEDKRRSSSRADQMVLRRGSWTLEHVMPQSYAENWPIDEEDLERVKRRKQAISLLGNMTLLTGPQNSSLQNAAWLGGGGKRAAFEQNRGLYITREILDLTSEEGVIWTESTIRVRGQSLASEICAIWPSPEDYVSTVTSVSEPRDKIGDLVAAGLLTEGDTLDFIYAGRTHRAVGIVRVGGMEANGTLFTTPSGAASQFYDNRNVPGWNAWVLARTGETLYALRDMYRALHD